MSGTASPQGGLTRRSFLKTTAATAGVAAVAGGVVAPMTALAEGTAPVTSASGEEQVFRGVCRPNCFGFCHLNVHVHDGKVMKTTRAPYNESCYDRICQRGLSHVQRIYDPKRLQYPMRRAEGTERGAGQWERVTWDEALTEIADKIKEIQGKYGESAVAFLTASGNQAAGITSAYSRIIALLNASNIGPCLDMGSYYGMYAVAGNYVSPLMGMMMWNGNEPTDAKNAKSIVVWGANITDAQIQNWHLIKEAKAAGVKLVVIDPIFTQIASQADKWIPIRPATDTLLKLALMRLVIEREAHDVSYLQQHTVAPYLVRSDTGKFLRRSDTGVAPTPTGQTDATTGQEIMLDPVMVLSGGAIVPETDASAPEIEGTADFEGVECRTAFDLLKDNIMEYTVEQVSELTEIPVAEIEELADIVIDGPVYHYEGYGPQAYNNGGQTTVAGLTLCTLLGNLGKPGASYGAFWGIGLITNIAAAQYTAPKGPSTGFNIASVDLKNVVEQKKFQGKDADIKMLWMYSANPLNTHTDTHAWTDVIIPAMDYVVTADSALTDTAMYSDMVLPVAQWFELEEVANAGQCSSYNYNEKAIEPLYESKPDPEIVAELAEKLGLGEFFTQSTSEVLDSLFSGPIATAVGASMDNLRDKKQVRFIPGDAEKKPYIAYENGAFATPTGRFEFYRETPAPRTPTTKTPTPEQVAAERLPHFEPPLEAWPENPLYDKYPLVLMSERPRYRVHSQWFSTPLLREIDPEPIVKINPADAKARGIEDQSYVEAYNDRGTAVAKAIYSEAIRPGTLVYPKGWQLSQHKGGGWSNLSSTEFDVWIVNNNFMDVLCEIRPWDGKDN